VLDDAGFTEDTSVPAIDAGMDTPDAPEAPVDAGPPPAEDTGPPPVVDAGPPEATHHWSRTISAIDITEMAGSDKYLAIIGGGRTEFDVGAGPYTPVGGSDAFVANYSTTDGSYRWSRILSGPDNVWLFDGDADQSDNVYVVGTFQTSILIEDGGFYSAVGFRDGFLLSYDKDGAFRWSKHLENAPAYDIGVTPDGMVTIGGSLNSPTDFGGEELTPAGDENGFLVRYDSMGTLQWARTVPGDIGDLAVGPSGEVALGGAFYGSVNFGGTDHNSTGGSGADSVVSTYRSNGTFRWSTSFTGAGSEFVEGIAIDSRGYVVVAGCFDEEFSMGGDTYVTSNDGGWVGALDDTGSFLWSNPLVTTWHINLDDVDTGPLNNAYLTGMHWDQVDFGRGIEGVPDSGGSDGFMVSYAPDGAYRWSYVFIDSEPVGGTALHVDSRQTVYLAGQFELRVDLGGGALFGTDGQVYMAAFRQ